MSTGNGNGVQTVPPWDNADLILPRGVAAEFAALIEEQSVAMQLGRTIRMTTAMASVPMIAFMPTARWVTPAYGGRKPIGEVRWTAKEIRAEEVAVVIPLPRAFIDDMRAGGGFDVQGQTERAMATAVSHAIDQAILFGEDAPASFPAGGVMAFADTVSGDNPLDAISNGFESVETKGIVPDGVGAGAAIGTALRAAYTEAGALPGQAPSPTLWGVPVRQSMVFQGADADAIIGGWQYLAVAIREDFTYGLSDDGVLIDDSGNVVASAFQDNLRLVKLYARIGCAIGQPAVAGPGELEGQKPFAAVSWGTAAGGAGGNGGGEEPGQLSASVQSAGAQSSSRGPGRPRKESNG